jgi:hypothetical protein
MKHLNISPTTSIRGWLKNQHYRRLWQDALLLRPDYPAERFKGRGLVFSVGGARLFINLWVNLCLLRRTLHCTLPIEVWHFGEHELTPRMRFLLEPFDVKIVDGEEFARDLPRGNGRGFALKTLAVIHSGFQEIVFLDTDSYPIRDPSFLFDEWPYRWAGACFWPDVWETNPKSAIWSILNLPFAEEMEWDSGQMLIDKSRAWRALTLVQHLTHHFPFYYQHVYGDKMLFYAVWKNLDQPYAMTTHAARLAATPDVSRSVNQFDFQGQLLFQHRATSDWTPSANAEAREPKSAHHELCQNFLAELRDRWPESGRGCSPNRNGKRERFWLWEGIRSIQSTASQVESLSAKASVNEEKWDVMASQALLSPHLVTPRLMGTGIEALWNSSETEACTIFRFFAALIFVDPRLAEMLPEDIGADGTVLQRGLEDLKSLVVLAAAQEDKTGLLAVRGNIFLSNAPRDLRESEKRRLQCLNRIVRNSRLDVWNRWRQFWHQTLNEDERAEITTKGATDSTAAPHSKLRPWSAKTPRRKILILTPLKDAADLATDYCRRLSRLSYAPNLLSVGLLESDSGDETYAAFDQALSTLRPNWRRVCLWKHDYRYKIPQGYTRWEPAVQPARRRILAQSRNELLKRTLNDEDWVLWLDADVVDYPLDIIEQLLSYGKDILHPHCVLDYGGRTFDRNAWRAHGHVHMERLRGLELLAPLDAVGGTLLFIRADLHRRGLIFPDAPYGKGNPRIRATGECYDPEEPGELETEGLGIMASDMNVQCWGLPNLEILHRKR